MAACEAAALSIGLPCSTNKTGKASLSGPSRSLFLHREGQVARPNVSFNLLLHHSLESKTVLEVCAEYCSGVNIHATAAHDKCVRGWFDDVDMLTGCLGFVMSRIV